MSLRYVYGMLEPYGWYDSILRGGGCEDGSFTPTDRLWCGFSKVRLFL